MKKCGIYFCLWKGEIIYIGKTTDFVSRLYGHLSIGLNLEYDKVRLITCDESRLDFYEKRWINKFMPRENHTNKGRKKYYYYKKKIRPNAKASTKTGFKMKFRIMTEKSIIGFGRYSHNRVGYLIEFGRINDLIMMYYNLSHISFCDDLLLKLKITEEWIIQKPGINKEFGQKFLNTVHPDLVEKWNLKRDIMITKSAKRSINGDLRNSTAERARMRNHGHFK